MNNQNLNFIKSDMDYVRKLREIQETGNKFWNKEERIKENNTKNK